MPGHRPSRPGRGLATASPHRRPLPSLAAQSILALLLAAAFAVFAPSLVSAQRNQEPPDAAFAAAAADLAERSGAAADAIQLLRAQAVTWNDACLGAADAGELCAQVLVDGWALWLGDGALAYRYHTDLRGDSLRLAEGELSPAAVPEAPLPPGATLRGPRAEPVIEPEPVAGPTTLAELFTALAAAGLPTALQEIAIQRDGIPVSSAGRIPVGTAAIEPYQLESAAAVEATLDRFRADDGVPPPANATIWGPGALIVILINAPENPALEATLNEILGFPAIATIAGLPPPPPPPPPAVSPEALPSTGSGGDNVDDNPPAWVWGVIGAVAGAAVLVGVAYSLWRRRLGA